MDAEQILLATIPLSWRLALSYAPAAARLPTLGLLALDVRLAGIVRAASEPMLAQLRLAWWREALAGDASGWPEGEPLFAALRAWQGQQAALVGLVDGWEGLTGEAPLPPETIAALAEARGQGFAALAGALGLSAERAAAQRTGTEWALADLAAKLSHPGERRIVERLIEKRGDRPGRLSRPLRPLLVLHRLALRAHRRGEGGEVLSPAALALAARVGLLGR